MNVVVDFETSGLDPATDWPIQIGMVGIMDKRVLFEIESFILPYNPYVARFTEHITGINPQELLEEGYPPFFVYSKILYILQLFEKNISNITFHAWNHRFDRAFMYRLEELAGVSDETRLSMCNWEELQPYYRAKLQTCFYNSPIPNWYRKRFSLSYAHNGIVDCYRAIIASDRFKDIANSLDFTEVKRFGSIKQI